MKSILFFATVLFSTPLFANCVYNNTEYEEGTVINGYICSSDGTWKDNSG